MGRQIAVKLSREKEKEFSDFLKSKGAVFIYDLSETKKLTLLKDIPHAGPYTWTIDIWNRKFPLKPEFTEVKEQYRYRTGGNRFAFHSLGKPVIEYSRGTVSRIYWDKDFGISKGEYDIQKFEIWYDEVVRWIKKNCKYKKGIYVG